MRWTPGAVGLPAPAGVRGSKVAAFLLTTLCLCAVAHAGIRGAPALKKSEPACPGLRLCVLAFSGLATRLQQDWSGMDLDVVFGSEAQERLLRSCQLKQEDRDCRRLAAQSGADIALRVDAEKIYATDLRSPAGGAPRSANDVSEWIGPMASTADGGDVGAAAGGEAAIAAARGDGVDLVARMAAMSMAASTLAGRLVWFFGDGQRPEELVSRSADCKRVRVERPAPTVLGYVSVQISLDRFKPLQAEADQRFRCVPVYRGPAQGPPPAKKVALGKALLPGQGAAHLFDAAHVTLDCAWLRIALPAEGARPPEPGWVAAAAVLAAPSGRDRLDGILRRAGVSCAPCPRELSRYYTDEPLGPLLRVPAGLQPPAPTSRLPRPSGASGSFLARAVFPREGRVLLLEECEDELEECKNNKDGKFACYAEWKAPFVDLPCWPGPGQGELQPKARIAGIALLAAGGAALIAGGALMVLGRQEVPLDRGYCTAAGEPFQCGQDFRPAGAAIFAGGLGASIVGLPLIFRGHYKWCGRTP